VAGALDAPRPGGTSGDNFRDRPVRGQLLDGGANALEEYAWHLHTRRDWRWRTNVNVDLSRLDYHVYRSEWVPGQSITWVISMAGRSGK